MNNNRLDNLDAFRGLAILCMVLSSSIAFGDVLPPWMFHAQTPPPHHVFKPQVPGITWVDLVFPFFLFSMGAAIPLALKKKVAVLPYYKIFSHLLVRLILLTFFAIFTLHLRAWVLAKEPTNYIYLLSITGFCLLFFMYGSWTKFFSIRTQLVIKVLSFSIAIGFLYFFSFPYGKFTLLKSDIIIIVLGNMAFFGGLIWYFTRNDLIIRIAILPFIMAIFLGSKEIGSINEAVFSWSPVNWLYKFYYLKYLFIIIPGTIAGDWLNKAMQNDEECESSSRSVNYLVAILSVSLIFINLWGLYTRTLTLNLALNLAICFLLLYLLNKAVKETLTINFIKAGAYLLLLGLSFEAFEGGIKKDYSTYSYYFVCSGLSFFGLLFFSLMEKLCFTNRFLSFLGANGKNPMIAYTAGNLLLIPLLKMTNLSNYLDAMNTNAFLGFARGIIFTGTVALITVFFTRIKFFWKT